jgi:aspartate carbamoyltransferase catalytic subunit
MVLHNKDILSVDQFSDDDISYLFSWAYKLDPQNGLYGHEKLHKVLKNKIISCLFYEPSTRTSSSFIAATNNLGGSVIPITQGVQYSSVAKGETLEDTVRTLEQYSDAIVLRHPEKGSAQRAAAASHVPIINAGDGDGEHPTQALLDLYTIARERQHGYGLAGLEIAFVGDLKYGRTVHSLIKLLVRYSPTIHLISPEGLDLPNELLTLLDSHRTYYYHSKLDDVINTIDVVYMTRVQKERLISNVDQLSYSNYSLTKEHLARAKHNAVIMHPLPRVTEIPVELDADPRCAYFRQVRYGLYVRMALLCAVVADKSNFEDLL